MPRPTAAPRTWPGGVQVVGPLLRIPGRMFDTTQLADADELAASIRAAVAALRDEFPERKR